uniref:G_PROTEIN_RECEP_F1_2 domain-containing protein n=1 Tax=Rhabditophanes sp. KR3021 TaxID=114890 RepID=A0AC35U4L4_9BILA
MEKGNDTMCTNMGRIDQLTTAVMYSLVETGCSCENISIYFGGNTLNCFPFPINHTFLISCLYILFFVVVIGAAVGGNLTVVWIILNHERMRTVTNYYLLNLAVADISITIFNTGFSGSYNLYYNWTFGNFYCPVNNLMGITPICVSVFTMIVLSIDRYMAIIYPLRKRPGRNQTLGIIFVIWVVSFLLGLPSYLASKMDTYYFWDGDYIFKDTVCSQDNFIDGNRSTSTLFKLYNHGLIIVQYVIPLAIICFTYGKTVMVLRKSKNIGDTIQKDSLKAKRKAGNMLALIVVAFTFMWLPYNLYFLLKQYVFSYLDPKVENYLFINIYLLGMSSSIVNPFIYYFMNERFCLGFKYAFRWVPWIKINYAQYRLAYNTKNSWVTSSGAKSHIYINPTGSTNLQKKSQIQNSPVNHLPSTGVSV